MSARRNSFFDPARMRGPRKGPDAGTGTSRAGADPTGSAAPAGPAAASGDSKPALTVSALLARIKGALAEAFPSRVTVVGEISNLTRHSSGHMYFRLKDESTAIDAVMFRSAAGKLKFDPSDGLEVVAGGRVDVYEVRGQLQLYVERMTPRGEGALELAFRQLCEKLRAEGLFEPEHKKPIPAFPRAIGVVTSATGAAIRDIRRTLTLRWPAARVYLVPVMVQGDQAAGQIAEAVALLDAAAQRLGMDTIIVGRGGGSLEDLWAFNEEPVARAIFAAATPIVSGVGHEVDTTIADLVADARAATPTAAAQRATPDGVEIRRRLTAAMERLGRSAGDRLRQARSALHGLLRSALFRDPAGPLRTQMQRVDELSHRLRAAQTGALAEPRRRLERLAGRLAALHPARLAEHAKARLAHSMRRLAWALGGRSKRAGDALARLESRMAGVHPSHRLALAKQAVRSAERQLESLSYRAVLRRGFTVTRDADGTILRNADDARRQQALETEFHDGRVASRVAGEGEPADLTDPTDLESTPKPKPRRRRRHKDPGGPTLFDATES